ncbi:hypothetical protein CB0940_07674 [Cercospora beticola]|uniref:CCHC-type domain-containing protein n=1 Tax=Cercospora beticola TaxID=122368 RepID=A0A2G5H961_CERBT|nr:hypothetical protein CB0940_07674 [Cercospora beticola]PIA89075.1 hypothetical protein CB0940_07674 [Cercospora beticola]WPB03640.1 hypothetical protein RHO25_008281 [Cercospora beticola]CAK1357613.1 unnamed protein product [Cercospora beticola]
MSDLENESRTSAVGRKRNATGKYKDFSSHSRQTSISSKESGEVSSSEGGGGGNDSDIEEISERQYNNKRRKTDDGSEDGEVESGDTSSSMDTSDSDSEDSSFEMPETKDGPTRLQELSQADRDAQAKYFDITNPGSLVRCLCCGELGHMAVSCAARTCSHCNQRDVHQSSACPTYRKCGLCRERGHDARECKNRAYIGPDPCDLCSEAGHIEEECPYLWRISTKPAPAQPRSGFTAINNGGGGGLNYDDDEETPPPPPPPERSRPWQLMGLFDDGRD